MSGIVNESADARSKTIGQNFRCRAWVNFDSSEQIRDSFNVSSITDGGTGTYTINFGSAFSDDDYAFALSAGRGSSATGALCVQQEGTMSTSAFKMTTRNLSNGLESFVHMSAAFFR